MKDFVRDFRDYIGLLVGYVPSHPLRIWFYKTFLNVKIGKNSSIHRCCQIRGNKVIIGNNVIIGENCLLDGRIGLVIEDNVNFSSNVSVYSLQHDYNSPTFAAIGAPVLIKKHSWISSNSIILPGVTVNEGAVVGAMCLVNKDVPEYCLVGGVPFKVLKQRERNIEYKLHYHKSFH